MPSGLLNGDTLRPPAVHRPRIGRGPSRNPAKWWGCSRMQAAAPLPQSGAGRLRLAPETASAVIFNQALTALVIKHESRPGKSH